MTSAEIPVTRRKELIFFRMWCEQRQNTFPGALGNANKHSVDSLDRPFSVNRWSPRVGWPSTRRSLRSSIAIQRTAGEPPPEHQPDG